MIIILVIWLGVALGITMTVGITELGTWRRGLLGGLAWPSFPILIGISRFRYGRRRRSLP